MTRVATAGVRPAALNSCVRLLLSPALRVFLAAIIFSSFLGGSVFGKGVVNACDQAGLEEALIGGGTVIFNCDGTIILTNTITISEDTLLDASGYTVTLSGNNAVRIFTVAPGARLSLVNLTIANGFQASTNSVYGGAIYNDGGIFAATYCTFSSNRVGSAALNLPSFGGAICNSNGTVIIVQCSFVGNQAHGGDGEGTNDVGKASFGGAIYNDSGSLTVVGSLFLGNRAVGGTGSLRYGPDWVQSGIGGAGSGGAIFNAGSLDLLNSTFTTNSAAGGFGAPFIDSFGYSEPSTGGAICNFLGSATLNYVTIAGNTALQFAGLQPGSYVPSQGGGLSATTNGTLTLSNSLLGYQPWGGNCYGPIQDGGHNISSDDSFSFTGSGSLTNTDPMIGPLGSYGGPTQVMPLRKGSPAIDAGDTNSCPETDQRGFPRPAGNGCDAGAVEGVEIMAFPVLSMSFSPAVVMTGTLSRVTFTVHNSNDEALNNISFTNKPPAPLRITGVINLCGNGLIGLSQSAIVVTGVRLEAHQSCSFGMNIVSPSRATVTNVTGPVFASETGAAPQGARAAFTALSPCDQVYFGTNFAWNFQQCSPGEADWGTMPLNELTLEMWVQWIGSQPRPDAPYDHLPGSVFNSYQVDGMGTVAFHQTILALSNPDPAIARITWSPYGTNIAITGSTVVGEGVWHHVAVTFRSGEHRLYVDGVLEGFSDAAGTLDAKGFFLTWLYNAQSKGLLDEVRLWKTIRTPDAIRLNMNQIVDPADSGLISYWRMDDAGANRQRDLTGHGRDLGGTGCAADALVLSGTPVGRGMLLSSQYIGDKLRLTLTGALAQKYVLQSSTDLLHWSDVATNDPASACILTYEENIPPNTSRRFYRGVSPP
jgi:hypothetical protein